MINIFVIIGWVAASFGLLALIILIWNKRYVKNTSNTFLFVFILLLTYCVILNNFNYSGLTWYVPHIFRTGVPVEFALGPLSYFYVKYSIQGSPKLNKRHLMHFIPALLTALDLMPFYFQSATAKAQIFEIYRSSTIGMIASIKDAYISPSWIHQLVNLSLFVYAGLIVKEVINSYRNSDNSIWKRTWFLSIAAFHFLNAVVLTIVVISKLSIAYVVFSCLLSVFFLVLTIMLFRKPEILYPIIPAPVNNIAYKRTDYIPFSKAQLDTYQENLLEYVRENKPFLDANLTLSKLAEHMDISRNHLSILLNRGMGVSFNDFINKQRIKYLVEQYHQRGFERLTIEGIASEVGFKSRTTFLHSVKKFTGLTPSKFIKYLSEVKA